MQWIHVRCCVELLLISAIYNAFAGCNSLTSALQEFQHFDDLKRLGTLLALSLIFSGGCDLIHSFVRWLRNLRTAFFDTQAATRKNKVTTGQQNNCGHLCCVPESHPNMSKRLQVIAGFSVLGAVVACVLLGYSCYSFHYDKNSLSSPYIFVWLCPSSIMAVALDDHSTVKEISYVWAIIGLTNAMLYAAVGTLISLLLPKR
jgi:hypothetical protein